MRRGKRVAIEARVDGCSTHLVDDLKIPHMNVHVGFNGQLARGAHNGESGGHRACAACDNNRDRRVLQSVRAPTHAHNRQSPDFARNNYRARTTAIYPGCDDVGLDHWPKRSNCAIPYEATTGDMCNKMSTNVPVPTSRPVSAQAGGSHMSEDEGLF